MNQDKSRFDSNLRKWNSAVIWESLPQTILDKCRSRYIFFKWHKCVLNVKNFWISEQCWPRTDSTKAMIYLDLHWSHMRLGWLSWNTAQIFLFSQTNLWNSRQQSIWKRANAVECFQQQGDELCIRDVHCNDFSVIIQKNEFVLLTLLS